MANQFCPKCGTAVTDDLPGGLCPHCLMAAAKQSLPMETNPAGQTIAAPSMERMEELFPEYQFLQVVGQGGMGIVYKARHKNLDRLAAIKVFLFRPDDPEFAERFAREARALAKLDHSNIVTVYDFGEREQIHFLVMEFVEGLNLRQLVSTSKLSPSEAMQMIPQLCDALQYAHDQGVVHRDIKPENILIAKDGRIKIADFGLAKITGSKESAALTRTRQVMGTLNYMAPEQMERPTEVDHRADIYSLGVVIYELLTGELPIGRFQPPSKKVEVDVQLDEVVLRALEKEPELRYQQVSEFKTGFTNYNHQFASPQAPAFHDPRVAPLRPPVKSSIQNDARGPGHKSLVMFILQGIGLFLGLVCGLFFIMGIDDVGLMDEDYSHMVGILVGIMSGFFFAISGFARRLIDLPPTDADDLKDYENSTKTGAVLRIIGMFFGCATGAIFIVRHYINEDSGEMLFAGICAGIVSGGFFAFSGFVDEYYKEQKS